MKADRILLIGALLLALFGFYLAHIGRTIQYDEAYTLRHFAVNPGIALLSYTEPNNHMLHSLLVWLTTTLAGESLIAVRFPALAMAILALAMMYRVGGRIGGWKVGIAAAIFLGTNWAFADYAVNARGYTLSIFLTLALIDLVFLTRPKPTRGYRYGLLLTCFALILTLPTLAILIAAVIGWLLVQVRRQRVYRAALLPIVLGSGMGAIFYVPSALYGTLGRSVARFGYSDLGSLLSEWLNAIFGTPLIGYLLLLFGAVGLVVIVVRRERLLLEMSLSLIGVALVAALAQFAVLHHVFYGRNYLYLLPIICLIAAAGLTALSPKGSLHVALIVLMTAGPPLHTYLSQETPIDQLLSRFDTLLLPGEMVVVGQFADEPIFYTLQARGQWNRLLLTPDKDRLIVVTEPGDDPAALIATYQLAPYLRGCHASDDPRWLPFTASECAFAPKQ